MRRLFLLLLLALPLHAVTTVTMTGVYREPNGNKFNGKVRFTLPVAAVDPTALEAVCPCQKEYTMVNGTFASGQRIVPNDALSPRNTFYIAEFYDMFGAFKWQANYVITTGGGTWDIGQAVPTSVTTSQISFITPMTLDTNQTVTGIKSFSVPWASTVVTGTNPFTVASTTHVANLNAAYLYSDTANRAGSGIFRFANADLACWRDSTNVADICIRGANPHSSLDWLDLYYAGTKVGAIDVNDQLILSGVCGGSVSNSLAEQVFGCSPNGTFAAGGNIGNRYKIEVDGVLTNTSGGNVTYTFRIRLDSLVGTLYCATTGVVVATASSGVPWKITCDIVTVTTGVGGTANATCYFGVQATTGLCGLAALNAMDTTVSHDIYVTGQMSVANAAASFTARSVVVSRKSF